MADAGQEWVIKKFCPEFASIQRMQYLSHSWKFSCNFYYSAVFSMTSCEAIWQLPFYNNSMHWQVDLVEMKPDHCFLLVGQQQNFPLDPSKNWTRWLSFIIYHLAFPDTPPCTGSPGVECRNTDYFYWGIKRKIKALGNRNLQCSTSSGSPGESEWEISSNTIMTFLEKESELMVKILTSELRISLLECHYPPLLVSTSSRFFFTVSVGSQSRAQVFKHCELQNSLECMCSSFLCVWLFQKVTDDSQFYGAWWLQVFSRFWPFQCKINASCLKRMETPHKTFKDEELKILDSYITNI